MKVLITDPVDAVCMQLLEQHGITPDVQLKPVPEALPDLVADADGWIIRSGTQVTADLIEAAGELKVIGRAGVGVDNVDLDAATRKGILVINAPDGNTISTAEHTCAMIQALARRIPQASASVAEGRWERKAFLGAELYGKTLGIIGVGKIGRAVAERMRGFGMKILGYDPMLSREMAERLGIDLVPLDVLWAESDYLTVHTPLNDATRGLLGGDTLAQCKPGVRIVNCARGGIVDEAALLEALESGRVAGAALDVYSEEPPPEALHALVRHPNVIATPHIAASTQEAQQKVARQVTEQVIRALKGEPVTTPVNAVAIRMASQPEVQPYLRLAERLGQLVGQLSDGSLRRLTVRCHGDAPHRYTEVLTVAALKGLMDRWSSEPSNLINALYLAREMGVEVEEQRGTAQGDYTNLVEVILDTEGGRHHVAGALFGADEPRLVQVDGYHLEAQPEGHLLFYRNIDRPGMLATVGRILAEADINIGALSLGRAGRGEMALTVVSVDEPVTDAVLQQVHALDGVSEVRRVSL